MIKLLIFVSIFFYSCKIKDNNKLQLENLNTIKFEDFNSFLVLFKKDTIFQKERFVKPILIEVINDDTNIESYYTYELTKIKIPFSQKDWKENIDFSIKEISKVLIIVSIQGIDNGLQIEYYFINKNGLWFLQKIRDISD